jgi:hypothetical protein
MSEIEIVVGIPYRDPSGLVAGTKTPVIFETQVFAVVDGRNPRSVLEEKVYPQHVWTHVGHDGKISERAVAYYVEQLGHTVTSEFSEEVLTEDEKKKIAEAKENLRAAISTDAQQEFQP